MRYLLDTCVISDFIKGETVTLRAIKDTSPAQLAISSITLMEIHYGLQLNPEKAAKIQPTIQRILDVISVLPVSSKEAVHCADIRSTLKKVGTQIGAYDALIGATALANDLTMVTANIREFERIPGLNSLNWRLQS